MAEEVEAPIFVPDPPPGGVDEVTAEWILRQFYRLTSTTQVIEYTNIIQDGDFTDHVNNASNPHQVQHAQLPDVLFASNPHQVQHAQLPDVPFPTILENPHGMMRWLGAWVAGDYLKNDVVVAGDWTRIAIVDTGDSAEVIPIGTPDWVYQGASPPDSITAKELRIAQRYTNSLPIFITGYRVYTEIGSVYRLYVIEDPDGAAYYIPLTSFTGTSSGWLEVDILPRILAAGTTFELWCAIQEPDPVPVTWTANYNYQTPNNPAVPGLGEVTHSNKTLGVLDINKTDDDSTDQSANLLALAPGDVISVQGQVWAIQAPPIDEGTYVTFSVAPSQQAPADGVFLFTFETVTAAPIDTVVDTDYFLADPEVSGRYIIDGGTPVVTNDAYGVDVKVQSASFSSDWETVAYSGR